MTKEYSLEEKLLNLIKKKKGTTPPSGSNRAPVSTPQSAPAAPAGPERPIIPAPASLKIGDIALLEKIRLLNIILFSVMVVVVLYFLINLFIPTSEVMDILDEKFPEISARDTKEIKPKEYSYYSQKLGKDIFKPLIKVVTGPVVPSIPLEEIIGNLSLLGIVSGATPQAIIEDKKKKSSYFIAEGQTSSGIKVKEIRDNSVTVIYQGNEFDLSM